MKRTLALVLFLAGCSDDGTAPDARIDATNADATSVSDGVDSSDTSDASEETSSPEVVTSDLSIRVVSGRADMVTGTAMLVYIEAPADLLALALDGVSPSHELHPFDGGVLARIDGLTVGPHKLLAMRGNARGELDIVVYAQTGPVFSGPHEEPFFCNADNGLGFPLDVDCSAAPLTVYFRKTSANTFEPLPDPSAPPADTATATTLGARAVPFVVRLDVNTINRAIAWTASLYDPDLPAPTPWQRASTWEGGVIYMFGGGCGTGYTQGDPELASALNDAVGVGFTLLHASLNTLNNNCNDVLSAETVMMVEEDFIERYGKPDYFVGFGGSGGSIQQHLIGDNYPGLLDGLLPLASFPDIWSIVGDIMDCKLLYNYFGQYPDLWPTEGERTAVTGFARDATCQGWIGILGDLFDPSIGCLPGVPADAIYDAETNPDGARCTLQDHNVNLFGRDPETGFARRAWGNAAIEYGLGAFREGTITVEQFVHLNEHVGGLDLEGKPTGARTEADDIAVQTAYRTGRILDGARLFATPIIDVRQYGDVDPGDLHDSVRTLVTHARIARYGDASNHVSFTAPLAPPEPGGQAAFDAVLGMDRWLRALSADPDPDRAAAARRTRPFGDRCYLTTTPTDGSCVATLVPFANPRVVAGGPMVGDIIQCARVPLDVTDYPDLSEAQHARLLATFPDGTCDWAAPPPNKVPHAGPWQRF